MRNKLNAKINIVAKMEKSKTKAAKRKTKNLFT